MEKLILNTAVAYLTAFELHSKTVGICWEKHKATEEVYESLFSVLHDVAEKHYATSVPKIDDDAETASLYALLESLKGEYRSAVKEETDEGVKNTLITALDRLQQTCAKLRSVTEEVSEKE